MRVGTIPLAFHSGSEESDASSGRDPKFGIGQNLTCPGRTVIEAIWTDRSVTRRDRNRKDHKYGDNNQNLIPECPRHLDS
jgi:hypothetical protein